MKKLFSLLLVICILIPCSAPAYASDADGITVDGNTVILVPADATPYESRAAGTLSENLSAVFGRDIPVTSTARGSYIAVGRACPGDGADLAENGYRIKAENGNLSLYGTGVRGLQAGACALLEKLFGKKVYTADITVLPQAESVTVPSGTDIEYAPFFEYTDTDWNSPRNTEYSLANGLNGGTYRSIPREAGGTVNYLGGFCHTIGSLCKTKDYEESHPEYLALFNGKRTADQPCLTNPGVLEIATRSVLDLLENGHDPDASVQIVSVTQNDNQHYCECENCAAYEKAHGGAHSATMINFVNAIADAVKEAGYDNVAIDTFAYQYTRQAPENIKPRDNVIVRLCTIECCFAHALDDSACENNAKLMKDLEDWSEICSRIYVWDYTTNYLNTCTVFPDFGVIQRNIQVFYEHNVKGVYEEGNYYIDNCDAEFGELRAYMIAKSLQDPYCDLDSEIDGFLKAFYGEAWGSMRSIINIFTRSAGSPDGGHLYIYSGAGNSLHLTDTLIKELDRLWARAKKQCGGDEVSLKNVKRSELSWRMWKATEEVQEYSFLNPGCFDEKQSLFDDLQAFGVKQISEGGYGDYLDCICVKYAPAEEWNTYEADEIGARTRLFFFTIIEKIHPLLILFGLFYKPEVGD